VATVPSYECQPRFQLYMYAMNLKAGDSYEGYEYINWISSLDAEYKKSIGKHYLDILTHDQQNEFTKFIRQRVLKIKEEEI
jgi:hypothetical protein